MTACTQSPLYWINTFGWTYKQKDIDPETGISSDTKNPHVPFITWDIQDIFFTEILNAMHKGYDLGIKKSREMGASWLCTAAFHYVWLFEYEKQLLEMSRTREYVDQTGNMKALFQKHDYMNKWLPGWMRPPECMENERQRSKMHMKNILNGSCIDGESTTEFAASGDRRMAVLLDEFAKVKFGEAMESSTSAVSICRIVNSTPAGGHTAYSKWVNGGKIKVFILPWWEHPEKGKGRHIRIDDVTKQFKIWSPWYEKEDVRLSRKVMAQEHDMDDLEAGDVYFNIQLVEQHKALFGRPPREQLIVSLRDTIADAYVKDAIRRRNWQADTVVKRGRGAGVLDVFAPLVNGRPEQQYTYVFGIDISKGQGASNSVLEIGCQQTGQKIAELAVANQPPHEFARTLIAIALWCGGRSPRNLPLMIWEKNGPGWEVGREIVKIYQYPYYWREKKTGTKAESETDKYGWQNNSGNNEIVMGNYLRLFETGEYVEPSIACLEEMKNYITYPDGTIGPASLVMESQAAKKAHGDRPRATSLMLLGFENTPKIKSPKVTAPAGSFGDRMNKILKAKKSPLGFGSFDFTRQ